MRPRKLRRAAIASRPVGTIAGVDADAALPRGGVVWAFPKTRGDGRRSLLGAARQPASRPSPAAQVRLLHVRSGLAMQAASLAAPSGRMPPPIPPRPGKASRILAASGG